ncbi:MAG: hypothetical protein G01um101425_278 [Candidatus Peregrinibacteria bacterium Gr01-1014_25]|nr:MAG: hypothetical protein G01um101425_278 [Candidatus Peregrinibacteria bacterium Gr01-1014_25]
MYDMSIFRKTYTIGFQEADSGEGITAKVDYALEERADAVCSVCSGTRGKLAYLITAEILTIDHPATMDPAAVRSAIELHLRQRGCGQCVCSACQEDLFRPGIMYRGG